MTSTSILYKTLNHIGANVNYYIPQRDREGHGLESSALVGIITKLKPKLVITVDCGISNAKEVTFLKSFKIDTIITDHHEAKDDIPQALAIINPKAPDSLSVELSARKITELTYLAGVGVAFKLCQAILAKYDKIEFIKDILPLVAVGTIADIVPLLGENRCFVKKGLELITRHKGLNALLKSAGYDVTKEITSDIVAFGIAPRLNASGRLESVDTAMKLLLSDNPAEIQFAVQTLNEYNSVRQTLCSEIFAQADEMWTKEGKKDPAIILYNPEWHVGIIGIVASHFVEKYNKPAFLMNYSEETKTFHCSARGIKGLNIFDIMNENSQYFEKFGGHEFAGGFSFSGEKFSFNEVKSALNKTIKEMLNGRELKPFIEVDLKLKPEDINIELCEELKLLEPCGASNPSPVFAIENLTINEKKLMGSDNSHLKLICENSTGTGLTCIWWKAGNLPLHVGSKADLLFHPEINEYNGNTYIQLIVHDIHSDDIEYEKEEQNSEELRIFDHRTKSDVLPQVEDYVKTSKYETGIFAESKSVSDSLKPYKTLTSKIFNRDNMKHLDVIMFFDYPTDKVLFLQILEETGAKTLHFMNKTYKSYSDKDIMTTALKMIKYAIGNNNGEIEFYKFASFLNISTDALETLFLLLSKANIINIISQTEKSIKVLLNNQINIDSISQLPEYSNFTEELESCREFQNFLKYKELDELKSIYS